ncbi:protein-disulfide reductase DsbD family protein [Leptolyngbya sp. 7M]|uniref:protein-disulfide reductase DsbD family protein n=1 Tax=Leptolyngbya sp. 7M TaxID=2812896 RepID=UPI001CEC69EE|nr:cytochrome c biogenesis protein CcdA [Leptolyngbya sp. 7M]
MPVRLLKTIFLLILFSFSVSAQDPTRWILENDSDAAGRNILSSAESKVTLKVNVEPGWYLYAMDQPQGGPIATVIRISDASPFELVRSTQAAEPLAKADPNFVVDGKPLQSRFYTEHAAFDLVVKPLKEVTLAELRIDVRFQVCNDTLCLPPRVKKVSFEGEEAQNRPFASPPTENIDPDSSGTTVPFERQRPTDLWAFIWLAVTLGALSLLTPCVFPMIPITVSYFTNHASGSRAKSVKLATIYSLGIIATFTLLGMLLAILVGAAGINLFAANPWVNLLITAIFLFFAFNLFGAYEITIPSSVLSRLDSITRSHEGEGSGIIGALLMGLTFTLTSFTCTSPFVGTILVSASQGDWQMPLVGMLAFSTVFALPFFVLALVPQWASSLPRAGGWMNSVKVSMGFLEVAAAMKFLSNVDLVWKWGIFTREVVLSVWIAIGIILAIYLLGKFQLAHDSKPERIGAVRLASAIVSLAISFWLITGLFGARLGELEAFLPPDLNKASAQTMGGNGAGVKWIKDDLEGAFERAKAEDKRVFLDFTGYTCTNCRWMEANIFPKPDVEAEFKKMVLVSLYTDGMGEVYERQQKYQESTFKTVALPFYAIVDSEGKIKATFPGLTRNVDEFVDFLRKGQEN